MRSILELVIAQAEEGVESISWFTIYLVIMVTGSQVLLLGLVLVLSRKMDRLVQNMDRVSRDAGKFVQMGMTFFKKK